MARRPARAISILLSQQRNNKGINMETGCGMGKMPEMTSNNLRDIVSAAGWVPVAQNSSHRQYEHPTLPGRVTIACHAGKTLPLPTIKSVLCQAGLEDIYQNLKNGTAAGGGKPLKLAVKAARDYAPA